MASPLPRFASHHTRMAEPIGIASGLVALATFAFQSSITLSNIIKGYRYHPKRVRDLIQELEALSDILRLLTETIGATTDVDLSILDVPLRRCDNICKEFQEELKKCSSRSGGGDRTSFRDWTQLKYMGDDIDGFRQMLAGYKSTISIALNVVNLRKSSMTVEKLEGYREQIKTTTDDLEDHLRIIDGKLESIVKRTVSGSDSDASELRLIKEEQLSTQKCLQICAQLSDHINQIQLGTSIDRETLPGKIFDGGLQECQDYLRATALRLEKNMLDTVDRCISKAKTTIISEEEVTDFARLREEWVTVRHCIDFCSKADNALKENISIIENYAMGDDAIQYMVSTDGKVIHGKNRGLGLRPKQVGGHLSDLSLQQVSKDITQLYLQTVGDSSPSLRDNTPSVPDNVAENKPTLEYQERFGPGMKLESKTTSDRHSERVAKGEASSTSKRK